MCSYIIDIVIESRFQGELITILGKLLIAYRIFLNSQQNFLRHLLTIATLSVHQDFQGVRATGQSGIAPCVTPIFKEQMECIILRAPRDQSHIR
jgi:hypothetical protein